MDNPLKKFFLCKAFSQADKLLYEDYIWGHDQAMATTIFSDVLQMVFPDAAKISVVQQPSPI